MPSIGLIYPGHSAEDDYSWLERRLAVTVPPPAQLRLPLVHSSVGEDAHRVDALLDLGGTERLASAARALVQQADPDVVLWACTSGSFVFGWDGAHEQARRLSDLVARPASSTSLAFANAGQALGLERVAVAATYPADVAERFADFLADAGILVTALGSHGIVTAAEVGTLGADDVLALTDCVDRTGAQAVLVPDTAMHTLARIPELERLTGLPVLTANQVTVWEGLRLLGEVPALAGLGRLFSRPAHDRAAAHPHRVGAVR